MQYRTVGLVVLVTLGMLIAPRGSAAQQPKQVARVGILFPRLSRDMPFLQAFEQRLQALGYREGHNLAIESRTAGGQSERLPALAAELTQLPVDVILAAAYEDTLRAAWMSMFVAGSHIRSSYHPCTGKRKIYLTFAFPLC
jgi:hypothetical protein